MDKHEFEQFVTEHGKDILRFCRMNAGSTERGNELYQDTMVKLLEKQKKLDAAQKIKRRMKHGTEYDHDQKSVKRI